MLHFRYIIRVVLMAAALVSSVSARTQGFEGDYALDDSGRTRLYDMTTDLSPETRETEQDVWYTGTGVGFSQDMVMRGSLSLSSLTPSSLRKFRLWGNAYWGSGDVSPLENEGEFNHDMTGAMIGLTFPFKKTLTISGYYNYNKGKLSRDAIDTSQTTHLGGLGLYYHNSGLYFTLLGAGGIDAHKITLDDAGESKFDGYQGTGLFEIGYEMATKSLFVLKPFTLLQYTLLEQDAPEGSASDEETKYHALYSITGAKLDLQIPAVSFLTVQGRFAWVCQTLGERAPISSYWFGRISGTVTPAQLFYGGNMDKSSFWLGVGARISCWSKISFTLDYDVLTADRQTNQLLSVGALLSW